MFGNKEFYVLNNAIDSKQYVFNQKKRNEVRKSFGIDENEILIGHVGRFCPQKNHLYLLDIFKVIQEKVSAKLILIGDGELRSVIEEKVIRYSLEKKVILTGIRSDIEDLLQAMDVFLFPSLYEGLPVTLVEAQAAGLVCLISDKVPMESKITDLVYQIELNKPLDVWADMAIKLSHLKRKDKSNEIKKAGFDIKQNAEWLQKYYLDMSEEKETCCL